VKGGIPFVVTIKILGLNYPERYAVRRLVIAAHQDLLLSRPDLEVDITEVTDPEQIGKKAFVLILPTLIINDKVVCSGRIPARDEVTHWLWEAAGSG
jgi:hypothetical protein